MTTAKRQEIRDRRLRKKRQQRRNSVLVVAGVVLFLVVLLTLPSIINSLRPVGEITEITPVERYLAEGRAMGDPLAPVVIEVFSDFQCSMCKIFAEETEGQIATNYVATGDVYYVYRQFPFLDDAVAGKESDQSANASMCAAEQNRFWDYHDILFANWNGENEGAFNDKRLVAFAETLGLNMDQFEDCFRANTYANEINSDVNKATGLGVTGTPTVFVNGEAIRRGFVPTYEELQSAIDAALLELGR